jgi:hypothetical protein
MKNTLENGNLTDRVDVIKKIFRATFLVLAMTFVATNALATVINIDLGNNAGTFSGQGAYSDPGNDFWNAGSSVSNLIASDGVSLSGVSLALGESSSYSFTPEPPNLLMADYRYVGAAASISISGLDANTNYQLYLYSTGDTADQKSKFTLNGVTKSTTGSNSGFFILGQNYVIIDVTSDANGQIIGVWGPTGGSIAPFNGLQIAGVVSSKVISIAGAESPAVHSPGDIILVSVRFSNEVTLSQAGGVKLQLDFEGTVVEAVQTGSLTGNSLTFEAVAPAVTTMATRVVANSLQLLGGATLQDSDSIDVMLEHDEVALPNDQISINGLSVYPAVPGLDPSPHYSFRVREVGSDQWMTPFAWFTKCKDYDPDVSTAYFTEYIGSWSHTYCNFEMANNVAIEVEISKVNGEPILTAVPHPYRKVSSWRVENGKAYVTLDKPALFAVDIDGQMDTQDAPRKY